VRLPKEGVETVVDLYSKGSRVFLKVSRILHPVRKLVDYNLETSDSPLENRIPVEISSGICEREEPLVREIRRGTPFELTSNVTGGSADSHYFVFFTDSHECIAKGISNPSELPSGELWTRLITFSYGVEQLPPRRFYRRDLLVSS